MKSIKVFFHGRRLKDIYPYATPWQVFKYRVVRFLRNLTIGIIKISVIVGLVYGGIAYGSKKVITSSIPVEIDLSDELLAGKIETLKDEVVETIRSCESAGHSEDDGIIIFDSNAKASVGTLQFQIATIQHYYQTLYEQKITKKEAVLIALDNQKSGQLAKDIIFKDSKGWKNWYNCGVKHGIGGQVDLIKKLSK